MRALRREVARSQRLASVGRLAAGVAHEIRNPLSSIKGFATYFKERYPDRPEDQQTADIMIQEIEPKAISLDALLNDAVRLIKDRAAEKNITVNTRNSSRINTAWADPDRVNQILLNLFLNAIDAMENGGELNVEISSDDRHEICISVSDTGCGISPQHLPRVFDPYFTTKSTGTGLGLAIAHNIAEVMGGRISVESPQDRGTIFRVFFPNSKENGSDET